MLHTNELNEHELIKECESFDNKQSEISVYKLRFIPQVKFTLFVLFLCLTNNSIAGSAIQSSSVGEFSPYFAAFSDQLLSDHREYERLKQQLMKIHAIDWDLMAEVKAFESKSDE